MDPNISKFMRYSNSSLGGNFIATNAYQKEKVIKQLSSIHQEKKNKTEPEINNKKEIIMNREEIKQKNGKQQNRLTQELVLLKDKQK